MDHLMDCFMQLHGRPSIAFQVSLIANWCILARRPKGSLYLPFWVPSPAARGYGKKE